MRCLHSKDLRTKITIKRPPDPADPANYSPSGQPIGTWVTVASPFAAFEPLLGNEYFAAESAQSNVEAKIRMRYRPGIDKTMRVEVGPDTYEIIGDPANVQNLNRELLLRVKKVNA